MVIVIVPSMRKMPELIPSLAVPSTPENIGEEAVCAVPFLAAGCGGQYQKKCIQQ
jgi:hypothetical protein